MKIIYLFEWRLDKPSGVTNKVLSQTKVWRELGHEVDLLCVTTTPVSPIFKQQNMKLYILKLPEMLSRLSIGLYLAKLYSINNIYNEIKRFNPDTIYYRKAIWYPGLISIFQKYKTIFEINTKEDDETKLLPLVKQIIYWYSKDNFMNSASAFIAVTNEISNSLLNYKKETHVIGNGYNINNVANFRIKKLSRPGCIMVISPNFQWHGHEKLKYLAKKLPGVDFKIVGISGRSEIANLVYLGYLDGKRLIDQYSECDIGIGTLSLYKKNMSEACPLKTCEYIAFGLPVIIGYRDTNLGEQDFVLNLGNYSDNVKNNVENIKNFIFKWHGKRIPEEAVKLVDIREKEKKRVKYFEKIINN